MGRFCLKFRGWNTFGIHFEFTHTQGVELLPKGCGIGFNPRILLVITMDEEDVDSPCWKAKKYQNGEYAKRVGLHR